MENKEQTQLNINYFHTLSGWGMGPFETGKSSTLVGVFNVGFMRHFSKRQGTPMHPRSVAIPCEQKQYKPVLLINIAHLLFNEYLLYSMSKHVNLFSILLHFINAEVKH